MNRDDILAMEPGIELDELIIKRVMEFNLVPDGTTFWNKGDAPFPFVMNNQLFGTCLYEDSEGDAWTYRPFKPSTDISAAWDVAMTFDVNTFNLNWLDRNSIFGEGWHCKLGNSHAHMCATAPEAICKAALLAVLDL